MSICLPLNKIWKPVDTWEYLNVDNAYYTIYNCFLLLSFGEHSGSLDIYQNYFTKNILLESRKFAFEF